MGISNLLPLLEKSTRHCHVSEYRGQTVAVDSYCWLHKGARSCALQLAKGESTDLYVTFCLKYVNMLLSYDIKPIMVFDGRHLPAKLKTEEKRRETKKHARKQGIELLRLGKVDESYKFFKQCIDVTPEMALALIKECRKLNVDCIVAPYESDAQLAFFNLKGIAQCIISEDSDLLLFGCNKVLYKMDLNGSGQLVEADKINLSMKLRPDQYSFDKFRYMCILSGCDYLESLPGIGLKKALKFLSMTAEDNPEIFLDKLPRYLNMRRLVVNDEYKENFMVANATFQHQIVFDPINRQLQPLNPIATKTEYCKNSGAMFDQDEAFQLALGNLNPLTMEKIDNWQPGNTILSEYSIWSNCFKHRPLKTVKTSNTDNRTKKHKNIDTEAIEKANLKHDEQVDKELEFYKAKSSIDAEIDNSEKVLPTEQDTSPVLNRRSNNPFIKKKISKFTITNTESDQKVVRSRFFLPTSKSETFVNTSRNEAQFSGESTETSPFLTPPDEYADIEATSEIENIENSSLHNLNENIDIKSSQISETESVFSLPSDGVDDVILPQIECECILEVDDCQIKTSPEHSTLVSVENIIDKPIAKKRKLEPLQLMKFKKTKKQVTIKAMFQRMSSV